MKLTTFDPADFLHTRERQNAYLAEAIAMRDPKEIADANEAVAKARTRADAGKNSPHKP